VAVVEIVSPGNKGSGHAIEPFARKAVTTPSGWEVHFCSSWEPVFSAEPAAIPQGIHKGYLGPWFHDEQFALAGPNKPPLTVVSLRGRATKTR